MCSVILLLFSLKTEGDFDRGCNIDIMLNETSQSHKDIPRVKFTDTANGIMVASMRGGDNDELVFKGYYIWVWKGENFLEMVNDGCLTTVWV